MNDQTEQKPAEGEDKKEDEQKPEDKGGEGTENAG